MEQLKNAEAYLAKDTDKQQPLPAELMAQAEGRFYDSFSDLSVMLRRFYEEGKNYIGVKSENNSVYFLRKPKPNSMSWGIIPLLLGMGFLKE